MICKLKGGATKLERHSFSWPESDKGQLELTDIINDTRKSPRTKLQNIRARTRYQDYRDSKGTLHAAKEFYYSDGTLEAVIFLQQNRKRNGEDGQAHFQSFYPNGNPCDIYFVNNQGNNVNGPNGEPALQKFYENGNQKKVAYAMQSPFSRYDTLETNGPNGEYGLQTFYENGAPESYQSFDRDENNNDINRADGLPTIQEFYPNKKVMRQKYAQGNGPRGFHEIKFDENGTITEITYYDSKDRLTTANTPEKIELLGAYKDNSDITKITVNPEKLLAKANIFLSTSAGMTQPRQIGNKKNLVLKIKK